MNESLAIVENISKIFDKEASPALQHINAVIPKGEIVGLVGPDGAGKTTLIRLIVGLLSPSEGTITISGYDTMKNPEKIHHLIGYMPQRFGLYEDLTVQQNLNLYADLRGVRGQEREETFKKLLSFTSLAPFTDRLAKALSGGMKQKLGLACALIRRPDFLVLDEPSVGVDPISRKELWEMVFALLKEGISVLWSTAYLDEAERCNTVLLLNEGKLLYHGTPQNLTKKVEGRVYKIACDPISRRQLLVKVLKQENVIDGVIQGNSIRVVVKEKINPPVDLNALNAKESLQLVSIPPRFEDAFVDILGGGPGGYSILAEKHPLIKMEKKEMVEASGLTKRFGSFVAASDISFKIHSGEIFGLLGPNGAGKSTTFKMMCGLLKPSAGKALVNGLDLQVAPGEARAQIGYMAQKFSLYGNLSVQQNLNFFSGIYNLTGAKRKEMVDQMIEIFNFKPYLNESAEALPLGFKQRLALSCAVMHTPQVLFLDEPTSGVDPITRREFWTHINGLVEKGVTIMVTTHFMDEAEYCDRVGLVYRGKMIKIGSPDSLKEDARTPENPFPSLEEAFIQVIQQYDQEND